MGGREWTRGGLGQQAGGMTERKKKTERCYPVVKLQRKSEKVTIGSMSVPGHVPRHSAIIIDDHVCVAETAQPHPLQGLLANIRCNRESCHTKSKRLAGSLV